MHSPSVNRQLCDMIIWRDNLSGVAAAGVFTVRKYFKVRPRSSSSSSSSSSALLEHNNSITFHNHPAGGRRIAAPSFSSFQSSSDCGERRRWMSMMSRPKVFVSRPDIPTPALKILQASCEVVTWSEPSPCPRDVLLRSVQGIDGLFCTIMDKIDEELLTAAGPTLKVVGTMSVGHDHVNISAVKAKGVKLGYTPDVLTNATAELTVAVLLAASRRLFESHEALLTGDWEKSAWGPTWMMGMGLAGSTVGIYGMGRIGQAVMKRLIPFGVSRFLYSGRGKRTDVEGATYVEFDELCKLSDFIIVTAAFTPATKEIFNARAFSLMKPSSVFVNTSRGGLVQQGDLITALKANKIFAAGLDVMTPEPLPTDHELTKLKNCVLPAKQRKWADSGGIQRNGINEAMVVSNFTLVFIRVCNNFQQKMPHFVIPHIGSATLQSRTAMAMLTAQNILAGLQGKKLPQEL